MTSSFFDLTLLLLALVLALVLWRATILKENNEEEGKESRTLQLRLRRAGIIRKSAPSYFWIAKIFLAVLCPLIAAEIISSVPTLIVLSCAGFFLPDIWLWMGIRKRQKQIWNGLSFYLDLVNSLLRAGMTLERSFLVGANQGFRAPHPLADEIQLLHDELELGKARDEAFLKLAERTGVRELKVLSTAIKVGFQSGAPIEETLEAHAERLRFDQHQEAASKLNQSMAISVIPVFLCGVPLWLVIVVFPAVNELLSVLGE